MKDLPGKNKPFISVVVPAFNEEKNLPACLNALAVQDYPGNRFEVTVVDNNSKDGTAKVARSFGFNVLSEKKQGYVFAIKKGIDSAAGEIVALTDADSSVPKNWLTKIARAFENPQIVGLTGGAKLAQTFYHIFLTLTFLIGKPNMTGFNCAVRKSAYQKVGGVNTRFAMSPDVDLGLRLKKCGKVIYVKDLIVATSTRRFKHRVFSALLEYGKGYLYSAWLRKPPPVHQAVIRG